MNEIFRDLAVLVNDQGEQLYDIEEAVVNAADRTKQARGARPGPVLCCHN